MTPKQLKTLRRNLEENTTSFGKRFGVSGRTVEDWEPDRRRPNRWVLPQLEAAEPVVSGSKGG